MLALKGSYVTSVAKFYLLGIYHKIYSVKAQGKNYNGMQVFTLNYLQIHRLFFCLHDFILSWIAF